MTNTEDSIADAVYSLYSHEGHRFVAQTLDQNYAEGWAQAATSRLVFTNGMVYKYQGTVLEYPSRPLTSKGVAIWKWIAI